MKILSVLTALLLLSVSACDGMGERPRRTPTPTPRPHLSPTPKPTLTVPPVEPTATVEPSQTPEPTATPVESTPTPTPSVSPTPTPPIVNGIQQYGVAPDGTKLHWKIYQPAGTGPWPFVLIIHGGGFRTGGINTGGPIATELVSHGFYCVSIEYRTDTQKLPGQTSSGRWHEQTDDVKMAARAARSNPKCNGQVFGVGGSAGATHVASLLIENETSTLWSPNDRLDAGVCISGAYDFSDRTAEPQYLADQTSIFNDYTGTTDLAVQLSMSPITFVDSTVHPMFLARSQNDPMPPAHQDEMVAKLQSVGATNFEYVTVPGQKHSFANWPAISVRAIAFLESFVGVATPSPTATPAATPTPTPGEGGVYPSGIYGSYGNDMTIPSGLVANKGIVGTMVSEDWNVINTAPGVYKWDRVDSRIAQAKAAGLKVVLIITNSSENTPEWLLNSLPSNQKIALLDPAENHHSFCQPILTALYWNPVFHKARLDLIAAAGAKYNNEPAIVAVRVSSFSNHNSADWNVQDTVGDVPGCPTYFNQVKQWLDAGWTEAKMLQVGKEMQDAAAAAFPSKNITLPIGGLAPGLAADYSQLARDVVGYALSQPYKKRFWPQRNIVDADWGVGTKWDTQTPGLNSQNYIKWMIRHYRPQSGLQMVAAASTCPSSCRQAGNSGLTNPAQVMQASLDMARTYGVTYIEVFPQDAANTAFGPMFVAATKALGGTPRP